jgi:HEAT repeat protein
LSHRGFDEQMAALDALKGEPLDADSLELIRKSIGSKSNFLVAKAARLAEDNQLMDLTPALIAAFDRFFVNAEKTDPQCWAKNAVSRALSKLGCRDPDVFLRGLHHHQMEPVWGGRSDSAGTLRANCAHALMGCEGLIAQDVLLLLIDLLADADKSVRVEAVRAIAQLDEMALPVLRLRALIPGEEPEVLSVCFSALLAIDRDASIAFVARFLDKGDDAAAEAAFALAETHHPAALAALLNVRQHPTPAASEPWFAGVLLSAIALTRVPSATNYLIGLIETEDREAPAVIEALAKMGPGTELRVRIERAIEETGSPRLTKAWLDNLPEPAPEFDPDGRQWRDDSH